MIRVRTASSGWEGGPGLTTFYFDAALDGADAANTLLTRVRAYFSAIGEATISTIGYNVDPNFDVMDAANGDVTDTVTATGANGQIQGTKPGPLLPTSTALLLRMNTNTFIAGRRVRGRSFVGPATEGAQGDGVLPAESFRTIVTGAGGILLDAGDSGNAWVVWHRPKAGAGGVAAPIVSAICSTKFAVLRSRRD